MHIHRHRGWHYVIASDGDVLHKTLHSWAAAQWARKTYGVELDLPKETD